MAYEKKRKGRWEEEKRASEVFEIFFSFPWPPDADVRGVLQQKLLPSMKNVWCTCETLVVEMLLNYVILSSSHQHVILSSINNWFDAFNGERRNCSSLWKKMEIHSRWIYKILISVRLFAFTAFRKRKANDRRRRRAAWNYVLGWNSLEGSWQNSLKRPLFGEVFTWDTTHPSALCATFSNWPISKESAARLRELKVVAQKQT